MSNKISKAEDIKIKKINDFLDIFMEKVIYLDDPDFDGEFLVTDESILRDFGPREDIERAKGPSGKLGNFIFEDRWQRKNIKSGPLSGVKITQWEAQGIPWRKIITERTMKIFRVDITNVFDKPIYEILEHILENLPN